LVSASNCAAKFAFVAVSVWNLPLSIYAAFARAVIASTVSCWNSLFAAAFDAAFDAAWYLAPVVVPFVNL
jgi:hypothetical protein